MKNYLRIFGAVSIWAVINGYVLKGVNADPTAIGLWMALPGFLIITCFFRLDLKTAPMLLFALGIVAGTNNVFFYTAIKINEVANAALVHYLAQPIAVLWLALFLKERLTKRHIAAMILGFAGLLILVWKNGGITFELWLAFALFSAFFYSWEIYFSRALGVKNVDPHTSAWFKLFFQIIAMGIGAKLLYQSVLIKGDIEIIKTLIAGVLLYISFIWVFKGLQTVTGRDFSIIGYIDRLGAVAIGIFIFGEALTLNKIAGGGLILVAQALVLFEKKKINAVSEKK